jgi:hypothetical protein
MLAHAGRLSWVSMQVLLLPPLLLAVPLALFCVTSAPAARLAGTGALGSARSGLVATGGGEGLLRRAVSRSLSTSWSNLGREPPDTADV